MFSRHPRVCLHFSKFARSHVYVESSLMYRAAFLLGFFGLLRISNITPPFIKAFEPNKHLLRRDVSFLYRGTHIRLKWAKNIQSPERVQHKDPIMCPTQTLKALMAKKVLKPSDPLLVLDDFSLLTQHQLRCRLATFIRTMGLSFKATGSIASVDWEQHWVMMQTYLFPL